MRPMSVREQPRDRLLSAMDAVGDADAAVGPAGDGEAAVAADGTFDGAHAVQMSDVVLGSGAPMMMPNGPLRRALAARMPAKYAPSSTPKLTAE